MYLYPPSPNPPQVETPDNFKPTLLSIVPTGEQNEVTDISHGDHGIVAVSEIEHDNKWNTVGPVEQVETTDRPSKESKSMPGTMVLVIGIILGAFVAMVLIVIIVLKMRTRVDGEIKGEESSGGGGGAGSSGSAAPAPRYQFAAPNDYGEIPAQRSLDRTTSEEEPDHRATTATTSLMEGRSQNNNGFFGANCSLNGERSRLFRKANWSKPVREWYV